MRIQTLRLPAALLLVGLVSTLPLQAFDHAHTAFDHVLSTYVNDTGEVDYKGLSGDRKGLSSYLKDVATVTREDLGAWSREEKLAFWMNVYNAYTLDIILDHIPIKRARGFKYRLYPENSIRQIPGVWSQVRKPAGGRHITLGEIENEILRKELDEPRIHFTIVCASVGCPVLENKAFTPKGLEERLEASSGAFILNTGKNRLDQKTGKLYLSKIFKWYTDDFKATRGVSGYKNLDGVVSFFMKHASEKDRNYLKQNKVRIAWLEYDWSLNEQ